MCSHWFAAVTEYLKLGGEAGRVYELMTVLDKLSSRQKEQRSDTFRRGNSIAFSDADIHTPTGHLLVKDLTFEVTDRTNA